MSTSGGWSKPEGAMLWHYFEARRKVSICTHSISRGEPGPLPRNTTPCEVCRDRLVRKGKRPARTPHRVPGVPDTERSAFRGVNEDYLGRFRASLYMPGRKTPLYLGTFPTEEQAARAVDAAAKVHRPDLKPNFPEADHGDLA